MKSAVFSLAVLAVCAGQGWGQYGADEGTAEGSELRSYLVGDMDNFIYNGEGSIDDVLVDAEWLQWVNSIDPAKPVHSFDVDGFDHKIPFTFWCPLDDNDAIVSAHLEIAMKASPASSVFSDSLWLESTETSYSLPDLGWLPLSTTQGETRIIDLSNVLGDNLLWQLADGRLNVLLSDDTMVDYAVLHLEGLPNSPTLLYVDANASGDPAPTDSGISDPDEDGSTDHPFDTIQEALDIAPHGSIIAVAAGVYNESILVEKVGYLLDGYDGSSWETTPDPNLQETIIDAAGYDDSAVHIIGANVKMDGFTVTNGLARQGGGVYCKNSIAHLSRCLTTKNRTMNGIWFWRDFCDWGEPIETFPEQRADDGAGIYSTASELEIYSCVITKNDTGFSSDDCTGHPGGNGGGIYCDSSLIIRDSVISLNKTGRGGDGSDGANTLGGDGGSGGGICLSSTSTAIVTDSFISGNGTGKSGYGLSNTSGDGGYGGGIFCAAKSLTLRNCSINQNQTGSSMGNNFFHNYGDGGYGGGLYLSPDSVASVTDCRINENGTGHGGGTYSYGHPGNGGHGAGVYCLSSSVSFVNCTFLKNQNGSGGDGGGEWYHGPFTGGGGGGLYCVAAITLRNCIISDNMAGTGGTGYGAAIVCGGEGGNGGGILGPANIVNCTVVNNRPGTGGEGINEGVNGPDGIGAGIYGDAATAIKNSIVWNNLPDELVEVDCGNVSHSDLGAEICSGQGWNISADPLFVDPNSDYHLKSKGNQYDKDGDSWIAGDALSPSIDAGNNAGVPAEVTTDLDGRLRLVDDLHTPACAQAPGQCGGSPVVDMGAYEYACPGNLDAIASTTLPDFALFALQWLQTNCGFCEGADFTGDEDVLLDDALFQAADWLCGADP